MPVKIDIMRHFADHHARQGRALVPVFEPVGDGCSCGDPNCSRPGKHPRIDRWPEGATKKRGAVRAMWSRWPAANIGIATGEPSGVFVVDVDGDAGRQTINSLIGSAAPLPDKIKVNTGRGEHYYFRTCGQRVKNKRLGPGVDVRGDGGYVVAPGSSHVSGRMYWYADERMHLRSRFRPGRAPDWLLSALRDCGATADAAPRPPSGSRADAYGEAALREEVDRVAAATEHHRNDTLNLSAFKLGQLVVAGLLDADTVAAALLEAALQVGLEHGEAEATIQSGLRAGQANPRPQVGPRSPAAVSSESDPLAAELATLGETDADNALRLARRYAGRLVCTPGRGFLVNDGKRWVVDDMQHAVKFAEATARAIASEAEHLGHEGDRRQRLGFARASLSQAALQRMLGLAKPHLMRADAMFDRDPLRLNVENGTLDLRTGALQPHRPEDWLTKLVAVAYDPSAACPTFAAFLQRAAGGDEDLIGYIQRAVGYSMSGDMREQVFFFLHGPGATGKSVIANAIRDVLGDYGAHAASDTFLSKSYDNGNTSDLARLVGVRLLTVIEVNWNRSLDEARLKALTGGDPITARRLYQDFIEFAPTCKLWLCANDHPNVRGTAEAFWRRVQVIPFAVQVPEAERDPRLPAKLKAEAPGILAWAMRGCLAWQRDGLQAPAAVQRGVEGWQVKADHVQRFLDDEVVSDAQNVTQVHDVLERYKSWCNQHGEVHVSDKKLKAALESRGYESGRNASSRFWRGMRLRLGS